MNQLKLASDSKAGSSPLSAEIFSGIIDPAGLGWPRSMDNYPQQMVEHDVMLALREDGGRRLKNAIYRSSGVENVEIDQVALVMRTYGERNIILRVDCAVSQGQRKTQISLAAIVSTNAKSNGRTREDADNLSRLRKKEAQILNLDERSPEYESMATMIPVYDVAQRENGPAIIITKYYDRTGGFYIFGKYQGSEDIPGKEVEREMIVAANQDVCAEAPREVILAIIGHQLVMAAKCHTVLAPSFEAGDYMLSFETGRYLLTTVRQDMEDPNSLWVFFSKNTPEPSGIDTASTMTVFQLLQIVTARSVNPHDDDAFSDHKISRYPFFTYRMDDIEIMLRMLTTNDRFLNKAQWVMVSEFMRIVYSDVVRGMKSDGKNNDTSRAERERIITVASMLDFFIRGMR